MRLDLRELFPDWYPDNAQPTPAPEVLPGGEGRRSATDHSYEESQAFVRTTGGGAITTRWPTA
jgi:hypothetical protein